MRRLGRDFEKLVAMLEQQLGPQGVIIKSPDYFIGRESQKRRESDISLRHKIGSSEVLLIVECRQRKDRQDVRWVDEVISKVRDIGADKALIVSSIGFSKGAKNRAKANNIEYRTLKEVKPEEFGSWLGVLEVEYRNPKVNFLTIVVELSYPIPSDFTYDQELLTRLNDIRTPVYFNQKDRKYFSFWDLWKTLETSSIYKSIQPGQKVKHRIELRPDPAIHALRIEGKKGFADVDIFKVVAEFWIEEKTIPFNKYRQYEKEDGILCEVVEHEAEINGKKRIVGIHKMPDKEGMKISISIRDLES